MSEQILTPDEGTEVQEVVTPQVDQEPVEPEPTNDEGAEISTEQPAPENPSPEQQSAQPDWKQKATEQGRENILLNARTEVAQSRIQELTKTDTPTDEAMRALYPEWDQLDNYNKKVLIRQETIAMQQNATIAKQQEIDARQKLEDQLDDVIDNSEYAPKLKGKEADFKRFARSPKNRGIAAETLAKAFLYEAEEVIPPAPQTPMQEALPAGSGGPRESLTPKKMPIEEARVLRQTNYKEWKRMLDAGLIEENI